MAATFHQFGDLPFELRDQIWNLAVRPACPGTHVFKLSNREEAGALDKMRQMVLDEDHAYADHQLIIPDSNESNISTYLIDGGLWTACKESRRVMERRFSPVQKPEHRKLRLEEDASATGYFVGHHGVPHYFTVLPHRDLFLFQVQDPTILNWNHIGFEIPLGSSVRGYQGRLNIAIEYKSEWGLQVGKVYPHHEDLDLVYAFIRMAIDTTTSYNIWLVDHNLRRKCDISASERDEPVSFSARGQRLVEVQLHHQDQWEYVKKVEVEEGDSGNSDSMEFVRAVDMAAINHWQCYESFNYPPCPIGLLGWDSL
ncbi:hypothetical protein BHE90_004625 [Fusarium euwallaceae]|uniref:2EXR domain-containing protein n=2 Tax=Fusarium solani species complex TaxID=232080 RepID=A0A3M2SHP6_9HYPO|nr:hypothetical protein CDV36_003232 [Fusarium kuroshium]RTE80908.1 hypothetical protein BHE90_004625 [Fusarium euwallaceae]